ncbi:NADH dehydrogenase [Chlorella sorokiniana]|uniref:NADH dehydrogenase n=1 Tax=Chlorella sorokiniana TaxID=3076 RepID=A0A2P6U1U1_CHLSO|nr:NADH dehydrogenase [Chlorella sorokiniana]|eukprot:PRW60282.1 NADH dehydrogenase [Chlorella sorokiniana]
MATRKRVLLVGGGFAGLSAARELSATHQYDVTLVDPKDYFCYVPAAPVNFLEGASAARSLVPFPTLPGVTFKQGLLTGITTDGTTGEATLQSGEKLAFDYALLATGSVYASGVKPLADVLVTRVQRLQQFADIGSKIEKAASVLIVGGGPVGIEVAAEILHHFPAKKVRLVCAHSTLLDRMDPQAKEYAAKWLHQNGVDVVTGKRISDWGGLTDGDPGPATLTTTTGERISADLVFKCVGVRPATALYAASLQGPGQLSGSGAVAVEPTLQVVGWRNVFAVGDCNTVKEEKTAALAGVAAKVAAQNIVLLDAGKELQRYPDSVFGGPAPMVGGFTLGPKAGVMQMGSTVQAGGAPAKFKAMFGWIFVRMVAGSRWWGWVYKQMVKQMVSGLTKDVRKSKEAAAAAQAANGAAAAPA